MFEGVSEESDGVEEEEAVLFSEESVFDVQDLCECIGQS